MTGISYAERWMFLSCRLPLNRIAGYDFSFAVGLNHRF